MKKYFIVSDVHSHFTELIKALNIAGFDSTNADHILVSLGDLFDRGDETVECLNFIVRLPRERTILIRGNHETLLERLLTGDREVSSIDLGNGTYKTIEHLASEYFADIIRAERFVSDEVICKIYSVPEIKEYFNRLVNFAEIKDNIFVHGWIPVSINLDKSPDKYKVKKGWRKSSNDDWVRASWLNGIEQWSYHNVESNKVIWCGHWHTSWGHSYIDNEGSEWGLDANFKPFKHTGIVAMDSCVHHSQIINCEVIEE